jgi:hypothetical protein
MPPRCVSIRTCSSPRSASPSFRPWTRRRRRPPSTSSTTRSRALRTSSSCPRWPPFLRPGAQGSRRSWEAARSAQVASARTAGPRTSCAPTRCRPPSRARSSAGDDGLTSSHPLGPAGQDFGRHGATVTYLSGTSYLVWGGNIRVLAPALYRDFSGVLLDVPTAGVTATPIAAPDLGPLPAPVAFHSATRLSPEHVLITGGLPITASSTAGRPTVELAPAPPGFSILVRDAGAFRSTSVSGDPRAPTILHQATVLTQAGGASSAVLVTGGALIRTFPAASTTSTTFWASNEVGVLTGSADVWSYRVATTLRGARFGHTTTVIEGVGVLVVGGYREEVVGEVGAQTVMLQPVLDPEFFLIETSWVCCAPDPQDCEDAGVATDAGRRDAGAPRCWCGRRPARRARRSRRARHAGCADLNPAIGNGPTLERQHLAGSAWAQNWRDGGGLDRLLPRWAVGPRGPSGDPRRPASGDGRARGAWALAA